MTQILVITAPRDPHGEAVADELEERGVEAVVVHPDLLLRGYRIQGVLESQGKVGISLVTPEEDEIELTRVMAVYHRRPGETRPNPTVADAGAAAFAAQETHEIFRMLLELVPGQWMTHPRILTRAKSRPLQLHLAARCGLAIPRTCVTNDPAWLARFAADTPGDLLEKGVQDVSYRQEGPDLGVLTSVLDPTEVREHPDTIRGMVSIFQERAEKSCDVCAVVAGRKVLACEIHLPEGPGPVDWRAREHEAEFRGVVLPTELEQKLIDFHGALGVDFGVVDLLRTPDDHFVFLESNPDGSWLWLEKATGLPVARSVAELLLGYAGLT